VSTLDSTWKGCGGYRYCIVGFSGLKHNSITYAVLDFKRPEYSGPVRVAVMSNGSRLQTSTPIKSLPLGELANGGKLTKWHLPFTGLRPAHYYALVIYSPDAGYGPSKPFYRQCFLTDRDPNS